MFITFDGIDGSGKTTISKAFARMKGFKWTKEPMFDSEEADRLNETPLSGDQREAVFLMDRVEHQKFLHEHNDIVCDRYLWTALAYGSVFSPETHDFLRAVYVHPFFRVPDCFVFVDTSPSICAERRPGKSTDPNQIAKIFARLQETYWDFCPELIPEWSQSFLVSVDGSGQAQDALQDLLTKLGTRWPELGSGIIQMDLFENLGDEK